MEESSTLASLQLRYWSDALRLEEALLSRPRARRRNGDDFGPVNLTEPVGGQDYAKLGWGGLETFLVERRGEVRHGLEAEWAAFFEDWLAQCYRRGGDEDAAVGHLVLFPTVHSSRDELAGVLRLPVELRWRSGLDWFSPPSYAQRRRGHYPSPPEEAVLRPAIPEEEEGLPYFIDGKLLRDTLRVEPSWLDAMFQELRRRPTVSTRLVVTAVSALLEQLTQAEQDHNRDAVYQLPDEELAAEPATLLGRLEAATRGRLLAVQSSARVFPMALVVGDQRVRATWHLQRDLAAAVTWLAENGDETAPLVRYLTSRPAPATREVCWGRWPLVGLTPSQLEACEVALGSQLSAIQGPPGTGKTTLILNAAAELLVRKVNQLADEGEMGREVLVVASTNNRAVDNVMEPLALRNPSHPPLSLRVGSRVVTEKVTVSTLERVGRWLDAPGAPRDSKAALKAELTRFRTLRDRAAALLAPRQRAYEDEANRIAWGNELTSLRSAATSADRAATLPEALAALCEGDDGVPPPLNEPEPVALRRAVVSLKQRLDALGRIAAVETGLGAWGRVQRHWRVTEAKQLACLESLLGATVVHGFPVATEGTAPDLLLEAAEAMVESLGANLEAVLTAIDGRKEDGALRLAYLEAKLAGPTAAIPAVAAEEALLLAELVEAAEAVRVAWALSERESLLRALRQGAQLLRSTSSLRPLLERPGGPGEWLRQLFPVWGCTLLSLGNVFPPEGGVIERGIIDEAGQCHPAYAVAMLLRAEKTLFIGDVHQLRPVVGLPQEEERRLRRGLEQRASVELPPATWVHEDSTASAQSLADAAVAVRPILIDHFRCQPAIAAISEALCGYGLVTHTPSRSLVDLVPSLTSPVLFEAVDGEQQRSLGSWLNEGEGQRVVALVQELLRRGVPPEELGVITPYRGQLDWLWRALRNASCPVERPPQEEDEELGRRRASQGIALGTVHRFQGGERRVVLFSPVVSSPRFLDFLDAEVNLLNVAVSRARDHFVTLGHEPTLRSGRRTRLLVERAVRLPSCVDA